MRINFRRLLPVFAIATGVALVTVTSAFKTKPDINKNSTLTEYYFTFNGSNGQEADVTQWSQISEADYESSSCGNPYRGCELSTTSVTGSGSSLHPAKVDVTGSGTNISPTTGDGVDDVQNRDASY